MSTELTTFRQSRVSQFWEVVSDVLIATALVWALPLLLGAAGALVSFVL